MCAQMFTNDYVKFFGIVVIAKLLNEASINSFMNLYSYIKEIPPHWYGLWFTKLNCHIS